MRHRLLWATMGLVGLAHGGCGGNAPAQPSQQTDYRAELGATLRTLSDEATDPLLRLHFNSIVQVIAAGDHRYPADDQSIQSMWESFTSSSTPHSPRLRESYLDRSRPLIVSWASPTDGQVSFAWLTLPAHWDKEREYPVYVQLHGLWDVAGDRLPYLAYPFSNPGTSYAFEDGYLISPWGRGNLWYRGIAETDIWEGLATVKGLVRVDESRQYLCGHSMGGSGAWHIALGSADVWAALGIHAGALSYNPGELDAAAAATLRDLPTYFVVGTSDGLLEVNQQAYRLLQGAGNPNLAFVTFPGGHDYRSSDVEAMYEWMRRFAHAGAAGVVTSSGFVREGSEEAEAPEDLQHPAGARRALGKAESILGGAWADRRQAALVTESRLAFAERRVVAWVAAEAAAEALLRDERAHAAGEPLEWPVSGDHLERQPHVPEVGVEDERGRERPSGQARQPLAEAARGLLERGVCGLERREDGVDELLHRRRAAEVEVEGLQSIGRARRMRSVAGGVQVRLDPLRERVVV
ncbi:MAG TPA: alpha/beta hydrolase-fold protein [Vicinamibacteria bacterium]|nr:alpha/beta hydrolase-fold protein [Vicinamibacteria bacterium]